MSVGEHSIRPSLGPLLRAGPHVTVRIHGACPSIGEGNWGQWPLPINTQGSMLRTPVCRVVDVKGFALQNVICRTGPPLLTWGTEALCWKEPALISYSQVKVLGQSIYLPFKEWIHELPLSPGIKQPRSTWPCLALNLGKLTIHVDLT